MIIVRLKTASAAETERVGEHLGRSLGAGDVVALFGDLGAGKTTLVKGIARGLGIDDEARSPTFTLIHEHRGHLPLYHLDLYRLDGGQDVEALGVEEYIYGSGVTVIEWADRMRHLLPPERLDVELCIAGDSERQLILTAAGRRAAAILQELKTDDDSRN